MSDDILTRVPDGLFMLFCDNCHRTRPHELRLTVGQESSTTNSSAIRGGRVIQIPVFGYLACITCSTIYQGGKNVG